MGAGGGAPWRLQLGPLPLWLQEVRLNPLPCPHRLDVVADEQRDRRHGLAKPLQDRWCELRKRCIAASLGQ